MEPFYKDNSRQLTKVTILATQNLVSDYLNALLAEERELAVIDTAASNAELLSKVSQNVPDVVLVCLMDDEGRDLQVVTHLLEIAPNTKVVVLSSPDSLLDQPASLKLGVTGIVGANQNVRVLVRAIRQVSEGEVWLNQKLIDQLIGRNTNGSNGKNGSSGNGKLDDLTHRELEVAEMVGYGMNNKEISKKLLISEATVRHHLSSIYSKLHLEDRLNLAIYAYQRGIVRPGVSSQ